MATEHARASAGSAALRAAIEAHFLSAVARGAEIVETPAFRVHLWPTPHPFYRHVAVPTRRPVDWRPAIAEMQAAFAAAGRLARLEFLHERWPDLAPALDAAGLIETARLEVLVTTERAPVAANSAAVRLVDAAVSPAGVEAYLLALHTAFEQSLDPDSLPGEVARLQAEIARGGCLIATITTEGGSLLAGASLIGIGPGGVGESVRIAELAGVWTAAAERGRGMARRVVAAVIDELVAKGDGIVWLAAENARAKALYTKLGFRPIGGQRHYSVRTA